MESDSPVIITIAESPDRDLKGLPHWVQRVLHHLCLVADGKPAEGAEERQRVGGGKQRNVGREAENGEEKKDLRFM